MVHVDVTSVGSLNLDVTITVESLPRPGETVLGLSSARAPGGKGANQAAAARSAGASGAMVGRVGADEAGRVLLQDLVQRGVDVSGVIALPGTPSGSATIAVDVRAAENLIIVDPGANRLVGPSDARVDTVRDAAVVIAQLEVPIDAVTAAAEHARGRVILNLSPATRVPATLLRRVDVLVVNASELGIIASTTPPRGPDDAAAAVRSLALPCSTIVTLGAAGALVHDAAADELHETPAPPVSPVDTTGAGDCFCGILAARLARGDDLVAAARLATAGAALSTLAPGARGALPSETEIRAAAYGRLS
jgi:ribokinase